MKTPLTIHLIIKNNESTIEHTLKSIVPLNANIIIGNLGSNDETISKCKKYKAIIIPLSLNNNLSEVRNHMLELSKDKWNLYIEPWETILSGHANIIDAINKTPTDYKLNVIQGDVITKQIRLWHKDIGKKFINPVFETLTGTSKILDAYLGSFIHSDEITINLAEKWRKTMPFAVEPIYYTACAHLAKKNWKSFLNFADLYLYNEKSDPISFYMIHYYHAMVNCYIMKNYQLAAQSIIKCLIKRPTMAEFWCLLGDIYYAIKDYDRAKCFYENAMILGTKRLNDDDWPLEISKYKDYPLKMTKACETIKQASKTYLSK